MKKFLLLTGFLLTVTLSFGQLLTENFSYTAGQLITANGWTAHSGAGTNAITVTSPGLTYAGHPGSGVGNAITMTTSGEDDNKTFTAVTSGTVYMSFLVNISAAQTTGDYFVGLLTSASSFPVRIYAKSDGAGGYFFGVGKNAAAAVYEATPRTLNTTYFIVANYIYNTGTTTDDAVNLWVNPALGGSEPAATIPNVTGANTDVTTIGAVYVRQGTAASASTQQVDAILAGTTWAQVTPSAAVPTFSATTLAGFGNTCSGTQSTPNSFTITGSNLTTANVNVGPLAGYIFSTTSGGSYSSTLNLAQPGGPFSQQVFVIFSPTAVQSYNGNIPVSGGGAPTINVAATGAGIYPIPIVTTGGTGSVTTNSATANGLASFGGCAPLNSNYGIEYSTTSGFANGTGTPVLSTNISAGAFSSNLSGLAPATTYYYHAYASNAAGTGYGSEMSFTTASLSPTITTSSLAGFGNICINTTSASNSFTITGSNLTNANIDIAALAGYTYSTTSGGTYTTTLSLPQSGGSYSQAIFVRFTPTAVQSYNGNIVISGGGLSANVNVAATGSGVNSTATVTTGAASAITQTSATAAGTITATGCSAITSYGIEYSTTNGFANGTGTFVASTNLSGGNFSSNLSGLAPNTTYYYKARATNGGGTAYGAQQSFTTLAPVMTATALTAFGSVCINTTAGPNSFTITGVGLTNAPVTVGALTGYTYSTTAGGTYTTTLSLTQPGGAYSQQVFVKFSPTAVQSYNGNIPVAGGGSTAVNVAAAGDGVNTQATVITGTASNITNNSATLGGAITISGCSNVTAYGIEYSGINGFVNGTGTKEFGFNLSGSNFSVNVANLIQGTTYYYKAFAVNSGGISYGLQQSFTVAAVANGFTFNPNPVSPGGTVRITMNNLTPGYYGVLFYTSDGRLVYQKDINIQATFINQLITIPGHFPAGIYRVQLVNHLGILSTLNILIQ